MGSKNRDRWSPEEWRASASTIVLMIEQGWRVMSICNKCQLTMWTDLDLQARLMGPEAVLWNRHPPCRSIPCEGNVTFHGLPPGMGSSFQVRLVADWPKGLAPPRHPLGQR